MRAIVAIALILTFTLGAVGLPVFAQVRPPAPPYLVIVHPGNPTTSVDRPFLADAFLKKISQWPADGVIRPVDLPPDSEVRRSFTENVLNRSVDAVLGYWQQRIFSGRGVPPPQCATDEEIVTYVRNHEGAVGYVGGGANVDGVKLITVR